MAIRSADEQALLATVQFAIPAARHILAFAPHPDDEVFGCGGILALLQKQGGIVTVIVVTNGAAGGDNATGNLVKIREHESRAASRELGTPEPIFWGLPDRGLAYGEELVEKLMAAILAHTADLILLPAPTELHPDHQALALAGAEAVRRLGGELRAVFYEINLPLPNPNLLINITPVLGLKQAAMACFPSQLAEQPYDQRIEGLNRFRSLFLGPQVEAAEAYLLLEASKLQSGFPLLFDGPLAHRRRLGFATSGADFPLVSIIIRSMDRPTLSRALDSLALQTWPNAEVLLVNAKGGEHSLVPEQCGRFPLRLVNDRGVPLHRSRAANAGLAACRGQYIGFLDDDDTLDPGHLHTLVMAVQKTPDQVAAYTGVRGVDSTCRTIMTFKEPDVGFFRLLLGNILPIHAVLFPASLLRQGITVDETLELYEDWDFWLQIAQKVPFVFVDQVSASYYLGGTSAISPLDPDGTLALKASLHLYEKWQALIGPDVLQGMGSVFLQAVAGRDGIIAERDGIIAERDGVIAERDGVIAERDGVIAERDGVIAGLKQTIAGQDGTIQDIFASRSWRITAPLRWAGQRTRQTLRAWGQIALVYRRYGGVGAVAKLVEVFRREGMVGIRYRLQRSGSLAAEGATPQRDDYTEWVRCYDTITEEKRARLKTELERIPSKPLISLIMPIYNPDMAWLVAALDSVKNQLYPHWELCLADDASSDPEVRPFLLHYAEKDSRIKVLFRQENGHISCASNSALTLATGEWIALLDQDDLLPEHALFYMAEAIGSHPEARLFYSDEDKIDAQGKRSSPYFKCDWNKALFYSHNLITHLGVYHAELVRHIGGFRQAFDGAQDYDLALRCIEHLSRQQIIHIPRVLYHWRMHKNSTALLSDAKPYAMVAGERALQEHLDRQGIAGRAELIGHGFRVRYSLPHQPPLVSLIIPTRNGLQFLRRCVESILAKTSYPRYELIIMDNASDDPETVAYLQHLGKTEERVRVVRDERPFNYSALNNAGVRKAAGELVGLLNNDLEVISPDWLSEMVSIALQPEVGAVGARLLYPDNTMQHGGVIVGIGGWAGHAHKGLPRGSAGYAGRATLVQEFSAVTGACLVVRKALYEKAGGLDETRLQVACNDVDFCLKLRAMGLCNIWTPYAELYHHESATRGYEDTPEKAKRFAEEVAVVKERWPAYFCHDPAYSPNLTLDHEDLSLAWPPRLDN